MARLVNRTASVLDSEDLMLGGVRPRPPWLVPSAGTSKFKVALGSPPMPLTGVLSGNCCAKVPIGPNKNIAVAAAKTN